MPLETKVDTMVPTCVGMKVTKSVTFLYILHWKWNFQRRVVLEIDFVRFRLQEVCQNVFAARRILPR